MPFFLLPEEQENTLENTTRRALNRFLDALLYGQGEDETRAVLEQERQILGSPTADQLLTTLISPVQNIPSREHLFQEYFQIHLTLLRRVPWAGIPLAFDEFEADAAIWHAHVEEFLAFSSGKAMSPFHLFYRWAQIFVRDTRKSRHFLEKHLDLLASHHDAPLGQGIANEQEEMKQKNALTPEELTIYTQTLYDLLALLRDARLRGGTVVAVQDAYVNRYNGFVLDLPDWLDRVSKSLNATNQEHNRTAKGRMILITHHIQEAQQDTAVLPQALAQLYVECGAALVENLHTDRAATYEYALSFFNKALSVYTHERYPYQYALVLSHKGRFYLERTVGEQRANIEQALLCFQEALEIHTRPHYPDQWAALQGNLGYAYLKRIEGQREKNQEEAISSIQKALEFFAPQVRLAQVNLDSLRNWARLQSQLSHMYCVRLNGETSDNLEQAIRVASEATTVIPAEALPQQWAQAQINLGNAYDRRIAGNPQENKDRALQYYEAALTIFTRDSFPPYWADVQNNIGTFYLTAPGDSDSNREKALAHFKAALEIKTVEAFPVDHRNIQLNISGVQARLQNWEGVHEACVSARQAETLLLRQSTSVYGHDGILREGPNPALFDGYALVRLSRPMEAAVAIELGRARALAQTLTLEFLERNGIQDTSLQARYEAAYQNLITNQALLNKFALYDVPQEREHLRNKENLVQLIEENQQVLSAVIAEIHRADHPPGSHQETLTVAQTTLKTVQDIGPGHALVYILATPWGGAAVIVLSTPPSSTDKTHFYSLDLPHFDGECESDLFIHCFWL
jgi:tetratricopeptide (TPR) repeat protein